MKRQKSAALFACIVTAALALGACGRRGPLEPHPDAPAEQRAKPAAAEDSAASPRPVLAGSRRTLSSPIQPPKQPFILDSLL
jgi:predicted small lipoprotein YifL